MKVSLIAEELWVGGWLVFGGAPHSAPCLKVPMLWYAKLHKAKARVSSVSTTKMVLVLYLLLITSPRATVWCSIVQHVIRFCVHDGRDA